ncbi:MAG: hypothetical protein HFK09_06875 [Clostridia bacterium]|nr:hypothetical protein [Clostridia bacterium]
MPIRKFDSLISNATAIMSMLPSVPSPKALREAPLYLGGKKDLRTACRTGTDSDKIFFRLLVSLSHPTDDFDTSALVKLHGFIFDGIRPDAGKLRTTPAEMGGSSFADASLIAGSLKRLLGKLIDTTSAPDIKREDFAMNLTYFFGEIFLLCPFRSASTFIEALFFAIFAPSRGFKIDYARVGGARLFEAAKKAFVFDESGDLFVCLNEAVVYASIESNGKEIPVVDAQQVKRELKVKGKPKTLVKRGDPRKEKPKKEEKPKKPRPEKTIRTVKKAVSEKQVKKIKQEITLKNEQKAVGKVSVEAEMTAARAAIEAEMLAAKAAIAAEAEAARAAIEAEKAAARAEMEIKVKEAATAKKAAAKKNNYDKSSRGKNSLKKALARTVLLFEDIPEFAKDDDKFAPLPPEKENPLLLPSHMSEPEKETAATEEITVEKTEPAPLPKLAPIKKIERTVEEKPAPLADKTEKTAPTEKTEREEREEKTSKASEPAATERTTKATAKESRTTTDSESEEDALARKVADMSELPSTVLKKAAHIKEKIEQLQKELKDVLQEKSKEE